MKNNILTHKIIPILAIFIFCFFSVCVTNVNAFDDIIENSDFDDNIFPSSKVYIDENGYYNVNGNSTVTTRYIVIREGSDDENAFVYFFLSDFTVVNGNLIPKDASGGNFIYVTVKNGSPNYISRLESKSSYGSLWGRLVYSSEDMLNEDGSIFFQRPPLTLTQTLVEETTKTQIMEQMKITIVGFLKYLVLLVISVIAFWKGWQLLSKTLRKA